MHSSPATPIAEAVNVSVAQPVPPPPSNSQLPPSKPRLYAERFRQRLSEVEDSWSRIEYHRRVGFKLFTRRSQTDPEEEIYRCGASHGAVKSAYFVFRIYCDSNVVEFRQYLLNNNGVIPPNIPGVEPLSQVGTPIREPQL